MRLHFTIGCYNRRRTSRCRHGFQFSEFKTFLLIMCIDAPESTTNSLSSGLRVDGAGRHQFWEGEKNAVLCFSFQISDIFGQPPRSFTSTSLLPFRLFLRPILKKLAHWGYADEDHLGKSFQAMDSGLQC